jgi:hypothetical protein
MGWVFLTFETLIVGGGAVAAAFFDLVGTCDWRFEIGVKICYGERGYGKVKMWSKVEIPKVLRYYDAEHALIYGHLSYTAWRFEGCQRGSQRFRGRGVATSTRLSWSMKHVWVAMG